MQCTTAHPLIAPILLSNYFELVDLLVNPMNTCEAESHMLRGLLYKPIFWQESLIYTALSLPANCQLLTNVWAHHWISGTQGFGDDTSAVYRHTAALQVFLAAVLHEVVQDRQHLSCRGTRQQQHMISNLDHRWQP
jgi:hypothetical protein